MRIKRGQVKNRRHKKILDLTKGYRLTYHRLYRRAKEALLHAGQYSLNGRRKRSGDFRRLWISRINAALSKYDMKYSVFMDTLNKAEIKINRKVLSTLALDYPEVFQNIVESVKK
ncbi:50S ribosomal protein L20 [Candidatus Dojkabacteria bacterium]|nr:50S ribosomal protein L20 [Candidatus Dojkabacteria bacterium]